MHEQRWLRGLSAAEDEEHSRASELIVSFTERQPYAALVESCKALTASVDLAKERWHADDAEPSESTLRELRSRLKAFLGDFRSFDDETSSDLSRLFGARSSIHADFKRALSAEYDDNFAYRLCATLRNAASHAGSVINHVRAESREDERGVRVNRLVIGLDGPRLAVDFREMKAPVRAELRRLEKPLDLLKVVSAAMVSCERALAVLVQAAAPALIAAAQLIERLHDEALVAGGAAAVIWRGLDEAVHSPSSAEVTLQRIEPGYARTIRRVMEQSSQVQMRPRYGYAPANLMIDA